jgi:exopolysaccharide biosynthesis polyprenyl glycosylphosphotransferase
MNPRLQRIKYIVLDFLAAALGWFLFYRFRKVYLEPSKFGYEIPVEYNQNFFIALICLPLAWLLLYAASGFYREVYRKSRLNELIQTLVVSILGCTLLFFIFILDDEIDTYKDYYLSYLYILFFHFFLTYFFRFLLTSRTVKRVQNREIGFNTIIIGSNEKALRLYEEIEGEKKSYGNRFIGFIRVERKKNYVLEDKLPFLGNYNELKKVVLEREVEEAIIAIESSEHEQLESIIGQLEGLNVLIKVIPDMYDILSGSVKMSTIFGAPLIVINREIMPAWQQTIKRLIDITVSLLVLLLFFPLFIIVGLIVKLTTRGPVIFAQERIGLHGKPFNIYKFRSMYIDAEKHGPALSSERDPRITKFGRFMRKTRLDEMPQFFNVLIGDMSLVGPRPERQFFIDKIVEKATHYNHLLKVRPGITSWGQVKYGYAENVDQMVERLKYDIIYIENMSLYVDIKILIYTVMIVLKGSGK